MKIERAHRVGPVVPSCPRTVVAGFERFGDQEAVVSNARRLKGTGLDIHENLCAASHDLKKNQLPLLEQAWKEGETAFKKHTKLMIKERTGQWPSPQGATGADGGGGAGGAGGGAVVSEADEVPGSGGLEADEAFKRPQ